MAMATYKKQPKKSQNQKEMALTEDLLTDCKSDKENKGKENERTPQSQGSRKTMMPFLKP